MQIQMVTFSEPKAGNAPSEWQDGAAGGAAGDGSGTGRFIVVDGATQAYDPLRWVDQLVTSFVSGGPALEPAAMRAWFAAMQDQWTGDMRGFDSIIEQRKFAEVGSFATLLGFEIAGLDGPHPCWRAVALGDTVLFHVRAGRLIATFPPLGPDDFGARPDGVHTQRSSLDRMAGLLSSGAGGWRPMISCSRPPTRWRSGSCGPSDARRSWSGTPWAAWRTPTSSPAWSRTNAESRTAPRG